MAGLQTPDYPDWPRRMSAALAAKYLGISIGKFLNDVKAGRYPPAAEDGRLRLWFKDDLDAAIDRERAGLGLTTTDPYLEALR